MTSVDPFAWRKDRRAMYTDEPDGDGDDDVTDEASVKTAKPRPKARAFTPKDAIFMALYKCRTGADLTDIKSLFGVFLSAVSEYFVAYASFLACWLVAEFPPPTKEQLDKACPSSFREKWKARKVQWTIDAHEQW